MTSPTSPTPPHTIEVEISPDGEIKATVHGVTGSICSQLSSWLDQLGAVKEDRQTADYTKRQSAGTTTKTTTGRGS